MSSRLRVVAALLVLSLFGAGVAPCAGWQSTAEARHDCCVEGQCPDQLTADSHSASHRAPVSHSQADQCCAASERQQQQSRSTPSAVAAFVLAAPVDVVVLPANDIRRPGSLAAEIGGPVPSPPASLHLLYSVFLV